MKKIAIITLQPHTNYGGILQAYALQTVLEKRGFGAEVIIPNDVEPLLPWFKGMDTKDIKTVKQHTDRFISQYLHTRFVPFNGISSKDYAAYVVGSDQIWRYLIVDIMIGDFEDVFLKFTEGWDVRRIAYAPSFGLDTWEAPAEMIPRISALLAQFDAVSVRESSGVDLCRNLLGRRDAVNVMDPTLLLERADYEAIIDNCETKPVAGDAACYILNRDEEKEELVQAVCRTRKLTAFDLQSKVENAAATVEERIQPSLEQWLRSFRDSRMVITDSFHATVFSIQFHRPFIVTGNAGRGLARLESILKALGLEKHLCLTAGDYDPEYSYEIPEEAYERLAKFKLNSNDFLSSSLKSL